MKLFYTPGSPFARIVRVLVRELDLACEEVRIDGFPPPAAYFTINPLGQVPALQMEDGVHFPTRPIIDAIMTRPRIIGGGVASAVRRTPDHWQDDRLLAVLLAMGDALAAIKYQLWAGLAPSGENLIGFDPAERHLKRVGATLDWLETQAGPCGFLPDTLSVQDIAIACFMLWTEARGGGVAWRGRPKIEAIVDGCSARSSFAATVPQPWP